MKLLFIGDSLIEYFDWQERFPRHAVYNMGIAGETVELMYSRIEVVFKQVDHADAIFIMSGINNLAAGDKDFIPVYRKTVRKLKTHYNSGIFIQSLLPVLFPWISNEDIRVINSKLKQMSEEEGALFLDIHSEFLEESGGLIKGYLLDDGVHVSEKGYQKWSDVIEKILKNSGHTSYGQK
jgi:lysophospholipase L1-like esterase